MKVIKGLFAIAVLVLITSCGGETHKGKKTQMKIGETYDNNLGASKKDGEESGNVTAEDMIDMSNKGIGPVKNVELGETIDQSMAKAGEEVFNNLCMACHKPTKNFVGPPPIGILDRRSPEWTMNMIMNPTEMLADDPIAKQLLIDHNGAPMADMGVTEDQARELLEYFRTLKKS